MIPIVDGSYIRTSMLCSISPVACSSHTSGSMCARSSFCVVQHMNSIVAVVRVYFGGLIALR